MNGKDARFARKISAFLAVLTLVLLLACRPLSASVIGWGTNDYGQLNIPTNLFGAKAIGAGYWHGLAVTVSNTIVAWGLDDYGQADVPLNLTNGIAVAGGQDHSLALMFNGKVMGWGITTNIYYNDPNCFGQADVPGDLTNAIAISAGAFHSLALKADGTVEAWGYDFYGQCDVPLGLSNVVAIAAGGYFSLALRNDGTVVAWGDDYYGQIDVPTDLTNAIAIAAGGLHGLALKADGTVEAWGAIGPYDFGQATVPTGLTNVMSIAAGFYHSLALLGDGTVQQWGDTSEGQSSPPGNLTNALAIAGGYADSYALVNDAALIWSQPASVAVPTNHAASFLAKGTGELPLRATWWRKASTNNALFASVLITNTGTVSASFTGGSVTASNYPTVWNTIQLALNLAANDALVTNVGTNSIFLVLSNSLGSVTSSIVQLVVMTPPKILTQPVNVASSIGSNAIFSAQVTGGGPLFFGWYQNGQLLTTNAGNSLELDNLSTTNAGVYQLLVSNAVGAVSTVPIILTVDGTPVMLSQPTNLSAALGQNATFGALANSPDPFAYQWYFYQTNSDTAPLDAGTNATCTVADVQTNDAGFYFVVASSDAGSVTSSVVTLTVLMTPNIISGPPSIVTATNRVVNFLVQATGQIPMRATWWHSTSTSNVSFGTVQITNTSPATTGFTGGTLTATNLLAYSGVLQFALNLSATDSLLTNAGAYSIYAVLTNSLGATTSTVATLTVMIPPKITSQPVNIATNVGGTVFFTTGVSGSQPLSYQWYLNGQPLDLANPTNVLELDDVSTNDAGTYQLVVTSAVGSATSVPVTLTVDGTPVMNLQPTNTSAILGQAATFTAIASGADPLSYQWYFYATNNPANSNTIALCMGTNASYTVQAAQTNDSGNYFLIVTNNFGSVTSSVANLAVLTPPIFVTQPTNVLTVTNRQILMFVKASGLLPMRATWWHGNGTSNVSFGTVMITNNSISVGFSGGTVTATNLPANFGGLQFALNLGATDSLITNPGNYPIYLVLTNSLGTATSSVAVLTVMAPPKITSQPANLVTNVGSTVFFSAGVSGSQPLGYQWYFNGLAMSNLVNPTNVLELNNVSTNNSGAYQLTVSNAVGTASSSAAQLYLLVNGSLVPPQLWLTSHDPVNGDGLMIALEAGRNYRIQSSTDLSNWQSVTNFLSQSSLVIYTNNQFTNLPSVYYRVVTP